MKPTDKPPVVERKDTRRRMQTEDLAEVNKRIRSGWELIRVEADSATGFTYILAQASTKSPAGKE